jgi:dihydrofolate reductase
MRKVILGVALSLDGLIEGPNGEYDWCFTDQDYGMSDFLKRIDAIFYGRKSYELMNAMAAPEAEAAGANLWKGKKNYVFSNTIKKVSDGYELVSGDTIKEVNALKNKQGKDIWLFGGAELTASLLNAGLVDELNLAVHPIILGKGKPLFTGVQNRVKTKLLNSKEYSTGLVMLSYEIIH